MITGLIVDDEARSRTTLATLLDRYCENIAVLGQAGSIQEAVPLIRTLKPQILFLDISMPGGTGFDLLKQLGPTDAEVIFITAYQEYALNAIKAQALDYLLKPLNIQELQQAVHKATARIRERTITGNMQTLISRLDQPEARLAIPVADGLRFLPLAQIIRLSAKGSYTEIYVHQQHILSSRPLKDYEDRLPASSFFRAHHSHIINLSFISYYHRGDGGYVTLSDGSVIDISKRRKKEFLDRFLS